MRQRIFHATATVCRAPVASVNAQSAPALVNHRVDEKRRRNECCHSLALFVDGVAVEQTRADTNAATSALEIERKHVRRLNRPSRSQTRADALASARKA